MDSSHGPAGRTGPFSLFSFAGAIASVMAPAAIAVAACAPNGSRGMAGWQSGYAAACKAVDAGSIPTLASIFTVLPTSFSMLPQSLSVFSSA